VIQTGKTFGAALGLCVLPFLPGDTVKIIASSLISSPVRKAIKNSAVS
jgi:biotin transporter BioY